MCQDCYEEAKKIRKKSHTTKLMGAEITVKLAGEGNNLVEMVDYRPIKQEDVTKTMLPDGKTVTKKSYPKGGAVYINNDQFFLEVTEKAWNSEEDGKKVLRNWLEERMGSVLADTEVDEFCRLASELA